MKPRDKSYDDLIKLIKTHKNPKPPWQSETLKFLNRSSRKDESFMDYAVRNLMTICQYSANEYNNQLHDRLLHVHATFNEMNMQKETRQL